MIINLHVPQLWPLYLALMVAMDISLLWFSFSSDYFEIKGRRYKLSVDIRSAALTFASFLLLATFIFVIYIWTEILKIKIISGV